MNKISSHDWSYEGECGPQTWSESFAGAAGKHQSPINIDTSKVVFNEDLVTKPLKIKYDLNPCIRIKNTGHTFQAYQVINGGPVKADYTFLQFHMHWGDDLKKGSEHLVDGHSYSAELHFVNWNHTKYSNPKLATESSKNDGLLVFAVFVEIGPHNIEFEKIVQSLSKIHYKNQSVSVDFINIRNLLPDNLSEYWTYPGSLTTPPCNECVTWIIFKNPIKMSAVQLEKCHYLYSEAKEEFFKDHKVDCIRYNDRPVCSLGDRVVYKSFEK